MWAFGRGTGHNSTARHRTGSKAVVPHKRVRVEQKQSTKNTLDGRPISNSPSLLRIELEPTPVRDCGRIRCSREGRSRDGLTNIEASKPLRRRGGRRCGRLLFSRDETAGGAGPGDAGTVPWAGGRPGRRRGDWRRGLLPALTQEQTPTREKGRNQWEPSSARQTPEKPSPNPTSPAPNGAPVTTTWTAQPNAAGQPWAAGGEEGYDLGAWPYVVMFVRVVRDVGRHLYGFGHYVEGDVDTVHYRSTKQAIQLVPQSTTGDRTPNRTKDVGW